MLAEFLAGSSMLDVFLAGKSELVLHADDSMLVVHCHQKVLVQNCC